MIEEARRKVDRFRRKGVLLDTGVLLVYLVGLIDPNLVPTFKRTEGFRREDFHLLAALVRPVERLWTTAHVATEVNNLAGHLNDNDLSRFRQLFAAVIPKFKESSWPVNRLCAKEEYKKFGLTDSGLHEAGKRRLVITTDFPISNYIEKTGGYSLNFTNIRALV